MREKLSLLILRNILNCISEGVKNTLCLWVELFTMYFFLKIWRELKTIGALENDFFTLGKKETRESPRKTSGLE